MDLNIRGEMEAAAAEMEAAEPDASPASEETTSDDAVAEPVAEAPETDAAPATEEPDAKPAEPAEAEPPAQPESDELPIGGSIPVPRVRKILENARVKARAEVEQQLAWAKQLDQAKVQQAMQIVQFAEADPIGFYRAVTQQLQSNPEYAAQLRSLSGAPEPATNEPPQEEKPQPDVLLEDGRLVYSADQMEKLLAWQERRVDERLAQQVKPLKEREEMVKRQQFVEQESQKVLQQALTWPGMDDRENQKAVAELMINERLNIDDAYRRAVLPKVTNTAAIEKRVREQVLAELKQKTRASTTDPSRVVAQPQDFKGKSVREILEATAAELGME